MVMDPRTRRAAAGGGAADVTRDEEVEESPHTGILLDVPRPLPAPALRLRPLCALCALWPLCASPSVLCYLQLKIIFSQFSVFCLLVFCKLLIC